MNLSDLAAFCHLGKVFLLECVLVILDKVEVHHYLTQFFNVVVVTLALRLLLEDVLQVRLVIRNLRHILCLFHAYQHIEIQVLVVIEILLCKMHKLVGAGNIGGNVLGSIQRAALDVHLAHLCHVARLHQQVYLQLIVLDKGVLFHAVAVELDNIVHHVLSHLNLLLFLVQRLLH